MASLNYLGLETLSKNLSYEGNYHKIYCSKMVYNRVRERKLALAGWPVIDRAFNNSFEYCQGIRQGLFSSDSVPDLLAIATQSSVGAEEDCQIEPDKLRHCRSSENFSFDGLLNSERVSIQPFLGGSETPPSIALSSPARSTDTDSQSVDGGSTDIDENELWNIIKGKPRRRSSSLKSRDSSSGVQARKKAVRFADVMGLDLHSVKHIVNKDEPPVLPQEALQDLKKGLEEAHHTEGMRYMCALFTQPGLVSDFLERVKYRKIALEKCLVDDHDRTVTGTIRIANICYNKVITIRYTLNHWVTFNDIAASYVLNSNDDATDKFAFTITLPISMTVGSRLEFALKFTALDLGQSYWDNNFNANYQIMCYAKAIPTHNSDSTWMHFL